MRRTRAEEWEGPAIGIDLETTYSCVGVWRSNRVEIIENEMGKKKTPSYLAFTDAGRLIGKAPRTSLFPTLRTPFSIASVTTKVKSARPRNALDINGIALDINVRDNKGKIAMDIHDDMGKIHPRKSMSAKEDGDPEMQQPNKASQSKTDNHIKDCSIAYKSN
ncbi:hypothetical protein EJ110_NYTH05572 [Nymphaea thermarum]|nr:hypothetical protein EJ110_NYTH05572 [Nymphaea thermarum]